MEEAKVVYVIYDVWTKGFLDLARHEGRRRGGAPGRGDRLKALLAFPDGQPLDAAGRGRRSARSPGGSGTASAAMTSRPARPTATLTTLAESWRQLHDRGADLQAGLLSFVARRFGESVARGLLPLRARAVPPGALHAVRRPGASRTRTRSSAISTSPSRRCGPTSSAPSDTAHMDVEEHEDRLRRRLRPLRLRRPLRSAATTSRARGSRVARAVRVRGHAGEARLGLERGRRLLLLRALLPRARVAARRSAGGTRSASSTRRSARTSRADTTQQKCRWTIYKSLEAIPEEAYQRIGHEKPQLPVIQPS